MTDDKIIKALECCGNIVDSTCKKCVYHETYNASCVVRLMRDALDLINRQKAEIERLKAEADCAEGYADALVESAKSEAIKAFAERLICEKFENLGICTVNSVISKIDNLVKEMVGDDNG